MHLHIAIPSCNISVNAFIAAVIATQNEKGSSFLEPFHQHMNILMNAMCLVVHLFHSTVTELLLEARNYIQGHADAYD